MNDVQHEQIIRLDTLKLAFQIEESATQAKVFYVDVGTLPKTKAEEYVQRLMDKHKEQTGTYWLPRREGGRGTEINTLPGKVSVETVLQTAVKLNDYVLTGNLPQ